MTVQKTSGQQAPAQPRMRMGVAPSRILGVGMDGLSRWPRLTCHNLVGISAILSLFVSIVGVSSTSALAYLVSCIICVLHL
jgi:hypothetical protein